MTLRAIQSSAVLCWKENPVVAPRVIVIEDGVIHSILSAGSVKATDYSEFVDLGDQLITPGLVNAHVHLELSLCHADPLNGMTFADWILTMRERMQIGDGEPDDYFRRAAILGAKECLKFGVTSVGDISQYNHVTRPALWKGPLRVTSYGEVLGLGKARPRFEKLLARALDSQFASDFLRIGISPHAPYTVDRPGYEECSTIARSRGLPLATHLAETVDEQPFLVQHTGPFRALWDKIGSWSDDVQTCRREPFAMAEKCGLLDRPVALAHGNYCSDRDLRRMRGMTASIVYCPRTHRYFGHPPHRFREMLAMGINVAAGTDSRASSPDLNLMDDLRLIRTIAPEMSAEEIWKMGTIRGAQAIDDPRVGDLVAGCHADFVVWPTQSDRPLEEILRDDILPTQTFVAGNTIKPL